MEPLSIQSGASQTVRPVLALDANLTSVLREGRTVAGEVLQSLDGKSLLIGVGRHRVPADSAVEMKSGDRFLARVELTEDGIVLKVLGGAAGAESKLIVALRNVVGNDLPVGELLEKLASSLRATIASGQDGEGKLAKLMKSLGEHIYVPGSTGEELRQLLAQAGLDQEAVMAQLAAKGAPVKVGAVLLELADKLYGALNSTLSAAGVTLSKELLGKLRAQLDAALADFAAGSQRGLTGESLLNSLSARLRGALSLLPEGPEREALLAELSKSLAKLLGGANSTKLGQLLLLGLNADADLRLLEQSLKSQLLTALSELGDGPEREAVKRTLAGIEAEQLLNVARKEFAEGWHLSMPVPDGEGFTTAHLFYKDAGDGEGDGERDEHELQRMTLTVEFSRIGPLRAELGVRDDLVALRLLVTEPEVAVALEAGVEELRERLSVGGREARVAIVVGTREEAAVDALNQNIRWLQEHHLMDLSG